MEPGRKKTKVWGGNVWARKTGSILEVAREHGRRIRSLGQEAQWRCSCEEVGLEIKKRLERWGRLHRSKSLTDCEAHLAAPRMCA